MPHPIGHRLPPALFILGLAAAPMFSKAQSGPPAPERSSASAAIDARPLGDIRGGLVANQTVTIIGAAFYQYFVSAWRDKDVGDAYALAIHERPSARLGSRIWIQFGQRRVFQTFLPPARASIRPIAEQAVEMVYQAAVDADVQKMLFRDPDLGPDEM